MNTDIFEIMSLMLDAKVQAYKDLLLEIDSSVYPEVYGYIEDKILELKGYINAN